MKVEMLLTLTALLTLAQIVRAQGTAFTCQGRLTDNRQNDGCLDPFHS